MTDPSRDPGRKSNSETGADIKGVEGEASGAKTSGNGQARFSKWFGLAAAETTVWREFRAGCTTFFAMAYILFINPQILAPAIIIPGASDVPAQLLSATALAAAFGSILMGLLGRMPIAVAPGMGLNAYFTYTVVLGQGLSWQAALGAVFVSGIVFLILTVSGLREAIINGIPLSIKRASGAGIGMFLALIGCQAGGIVVANPVTMLGMGDMTAPAALLAMGGLAFTGALILRRIPGAILLGVFSISFIAVVFHLPVFDGKPFVGVSNGADMGILASIVRFPVWPSDLVGALDIRGAMDLGVAGVVFTFLFVAFFDTAGTLIGLSEVAKFADQEGRIPRVGQAFASDAIATTVGALMGTSTTTAYMESVAGIEDGGKTGLVAIFTGFLFLLSLVFWPLAAAVPMVATAPALIILGAMLMESAAKIDWRDFKEGIPAFVTMIGMPLTFSIANGISLGILTHVMIALLSKRAKEVHPVMYGLFTVLILKYLWQGAAHN
jgi:adenine/guanine/hypoxanthine permease